MHHATIVNFSFEIKNQLIARTNLNCLKLIRLVAILNTDTLTARRLMISLSLVREY